MDKSEGEMKRIPMIGRRALNTKRKAAIFQIKECRERIAGSEGIRVEGRPTPST